MLNRQGASRPVLAASVLVLMASSFYALLHNLRTHENLPTAVFVPLKRVQPKPAIATAPIIAPPSFDVVRVDAQGSAVIAGRAQPGANVVIMDGDTKIGHITADARGEWVFMPGQPLTPGRHDLNLSATSAGGSAITGQEPVVLVVPEHSGGETLAIMQVHQGGSIVLQGPNALAGAGPLSIGSVDYDDGHLSASGKGDAGTSVRFYLDNRDIGGAAVDGDGHWLLVPQSQSLGSGKHSLRIDELGPEGKVGFRVEVSFSNEADAKSVTVEPGNCLWRIAHHRYGRGSAYTLIYQANKTLVRDPNLIYPGQVFSLPQQ